MSEEPILPVPRQQVGLITRLAQQREMGLVVLLIVTFAAVGIRNPSFLYGGNLVDMLVHVAPTAIVACGMTLVIVTGEIDISVGSLMGLLATVMAVLASPSHRGLPVGVAILLTLALGALIGFVNGALVAWVGMPSIIVTLGMLTALSGVNDLVLNGSSITDMPPGLRFFGIGHIAGIPVSLVVAAVVIAVSAILIRWSRLGRWVYAVGSNLQAVRLAGLPDRGIKVLVFTLTGFLTAVATLVSATQLSTIESGIGQGFELVVVTAVVVGGTSVSGGQGTLLGTILAVILLGIIRTVLIFLHLDVSATYWERAIQGAFILAAVLVDHIARSRSDHAVPG